MRYQDWRIKFLEQAGEVKGWRKSLVEKDGDVDGVVVLEMKGSLV
jgi:hypothetical protein